MKLEDIKKFFEDNKDNQEVKEYLGDLKVITPEGFKAFIKTKEGKDLIQPDIDAFHTKGIEAWKKNNLQTLIEEEISRRNPPQTEEQKRLAKLEADLAAERKARLQENFRNKALLFLGDKKLNPKLAEYIGEVDSEEALNIKLSGIADIFTEFSQNTAKEYQALNGRKIDKPVIKTNLTKEALKAMTPAQIMELPSDEVDAVLSQ